MYPKLQAYIAQLLKEMPVLPPEREQELLKIAEFIRQRRAGGHAAELIFICSHNSRRSHLGQVWSQTLAHYFGLQHFRAYSGGIRATLFGPHAIRAIEQAGFHVIQLNEGSNPLYRIRFDDRHHGITAFSKVYTHPANPQKDFCAVMTCAQADEACPHIPGALLRVALPYEDPGQYDKSPQRDAMYTRRSREIATEFAWLFVQLAS